MSRLRANKRILDKLEGVLAAIAPERCGLDGEALRLYLRTWVEEPVRSVIDDMKGRAGEPDCWKGVRATMDRRLTWLRFGDGLWKSEAPAWRATATRRAQSFWELKWETTDTHADTYITVTAEAPTLDKLDAITFGIARSLGFDPK